MSKEDTLFYLSVFLNRPIVSLESIDEGDMCHLMKLRVGPFNANVVCDYTLKQYGWTIPELQTLAQARGIKMFMVKADSHDRAHRAKIERHLYSLYSLYSTYTPKESLVELKIVLRDVYPEGDLRIIPTLEHLKYLNINGKSGFWRVFRMDHKRSLKIIQTWESYNA